MWVPLGYHSYVIFAGCERLLGPKQRLAYYTGLPKLSGGLRTPYAALHIWSHAPGTGFRFLVLQALRVITKCGGKGRPRGEVHCSILEEQPLLDPTGPRMHGNLEPSDPRRRSRHPLAVGSRRRQPVTAVTAGRDASSPSGTHPPSNVVTASEAGHGIHGAAWTGPGA